MRLYYRYVTSREHRRIGPALLLMAALELPGQSIASIDSFPDAGWSRMASALSNHADRKSGATAGSQDKVFPRIVCGNGWETAAIILNMGTAPLSFRQFFKDADGSPMPVKLAAATTSTFEGALAPNSTATLTICGDEGPFREGWSVLSYDETRGRLGGYAVIRRRAQGGDFNFEASIPLSNMQDFMAYMPFDNTQGFRTELTLLNPASNLAAQVRLSYFSAGGELLLVDAVVLKPGQQMTLALPDTYPDLANKMGTAMIEANINRFSATGLRYNPASGAIASVPAMNWGGMLQ